MDLSQIALIAFIGALAAYAVKELVDRLVNLFWPHQRSRSSLARLDQNLEQQLERDSLMRRMHLYTEFTRNIDQAVADLSIGPARMALVYAARDYYREISHEAPKDVVAAARRMCRVCEEIMLNDHSDVRYNRYQRARKVFADACVADTGQLPAVASAEADAAESGVIDASRSFSPTD